MIPFENTSAIIEFTRIYLAVFYTAVALFYTVRIITAKKNTHSELVFLGQPFCSHWWNHMTFRLFRVLALDNVRNSQSYLDIHLTAGKKA